MDINKLTEYAESKEKKPESFQTEMKEKYTLLLDNDLKLSMNHNDIWKILLDIQKILNRHYQILTQLLEDKESGKGSGQMQVNPNNQEPAPEPTQPATQEAQVEYQPKTLTEVTDRVAAMRQQANPAISQRYSSNRPGH